MSTRVDVIVIGAGIAGASLAARLGDAVSAVVIDMEAHPGYHATGRSAAYFAPAYGNQVVRDITAASSGFFHAPPEGFSDTRLLKPRGSLFVARPEQEHRLAQLVRDAAHLRAVTPDEAARFVPVLDKARLAGAAHDADGGDLDVDAILQGFLRQFRRNGGRVETGTRCEALSFRDGSWHAGEFTAPVVVNAAGAWADEIAALAGLAPLGLQPMRRTAFLVDAPRGMTPDWPLVIDVDEQFYFKPDAGTLLMSPADETPLAPCDAWPDEIDVATAVARIQEIADIEVARVRRQWAGLRTFAPDRTFVVGFDPRASGFFWLAGQGGYGVQTSPALSDIAAAMITGTRRTVSIELFARIGPLVSPDRLIG